MCIPVGVNGLKPEWTRLDTGCDSALEWAANSGTARRDGKTSIGFTGSGGNCIYTEVQLGSERVPAVKTGVHRSQMFSGEAGLLGNGLLSKYCVTVDAKKMQLVLERR
jgi:hypothetical protein